MATIKEIAAEAGVSVMTVSNVINGNKGKVSEKTEKRIREIMEKMDYVPNMVARSLISKSSRIIALLLPLWHTTSASMLLDPYAGQLVGHLEELLRKKEYYVMVCSFENVDQVLKIQQTWQIDGMILVMPHDDPVTRELIQRNRRPLVVFDRYFEDIPMLSVGLDDRKGGYIAARYLLEAGHREIGFAAPAIHESEVIRERYQGYVDALREFGLEPNPQWVFDHVFHQEGGEETAERLYQLERRPSAIIATEDLLACGIVKRMQAKGGRVPKDLSVIGYDDSSPARLITPALTTVAQDIRKKAEEGVRLLREAIENPEMHEGRVLLDVKLVKRESVAEK